MFSVFFIVRQIKSDPTALTRNSVVSVSATDSTRLVKQEISSSVATQETADRPQSVSQISTSSWKNTYRNEKYGFQINYPDWITSEIYTGSKNREDNGGIVFFHVPNAQREMEYCGFANSSMNARSQQEILSSVSSSSNAIYHEDPESSYKASKIKSLSVGGFDGVMVFVPGSFADYFHFFFLTQKGVVELYGSAFSENNSLCDNMLSTLKSIK